MSRLQKAPFEQSSGEAALAATYHREYRRVDDAYRRMLILTSTRHRPADARAAADELTRALRAATTTASRALQMLDTPTGRSSRRARRHRKATRTSPPATRFWATEMVRLAGISVWLRRETLDDLGVHLPAAVRVGSRAASGPHVAGLVAEPDDLVAATLHQPWIGVDVRATVDGVTAEPTAQPDRPAGSQVARAA